MAEHGPHCPFLNRTDDRCSAHFSLNRLRSLFDECFGEYHACPVYGELLAERQARRAEADRANHGNRIVQLTINTSVCNARGPGRAAGIPRSSGRGARPGR